MFIPPQQQSSWHSKQRSHASFPLTSAYSDSCQAGEADADRCDGPRLQPIDARVDTLQPMDARQRRDILRFSPNAPWLLFVSSLKALCFKKQILSRWKIQIKQDVLCVGHFLWWKNDPLWTAKNTKNSTSTKMSPYWWCYDEVTVKRGFFKI